MPLLEMDNRLFGRSGSGFGDVGVALVAAALGLYRPA